MPPILFVALALAASPTVKPTISPDPASLVITDRQHATAQKLVKQMGSEHFRKRNEAYQELRNLGRVALPTLSHAVGKESDPEIRYRCELLLPAALTDDFSARLAVFLADTRGEYEHQLPGWNQFRKLASDNRLSREFFAMMMQDEDNRGLLEGFAHDQQELANRITLRRGRLYEMMYPQSFNGRVTQRYEPTLTDAVTLLFCEAALGEETEPAAGNRMITITSLLYRPKVKSELTSGKYSILAKSLVVSWLTSRTTAAGCYQAMSVARQLSIPEGKQVAAKIIQMKNVPNQFYKANAASMIAGYGDKEDVKLLLPMLNDDTIIRRAAGTIGEIQIRDVGLAMILHLTKRDLKDFGFSRRAQGTNPPSYSAQWFPSEKERTAAFRKWAELEPKLAPAMKPDKD